MTKPGPKCSVCAWEQQYGTKVTSGDSYREIGAMTGTSKDSVMRHFRHLQTDLMATLPTTNSTLIDPDSPVRILAFDLETRPNLGFFWRIWQENISPAQIEEFTEVICFGARWLGEEDGEVIFKSVYHDGKEDMLQTLWDLFHEADAVMGWNSARFDSRHVKREFLEAGMRPPSPWKELDLMKAVKREFAFVSNKLDSVSQRLDVGEKVKHQGFDLWRDCMNNDPDAWEKMKEYQIQDVNLLLDLHARLLPWIKDHPRVAVEDGKLRCKNCGSLDLDHENAKLHRAPTRTYEMVGCNTCGHWNKNPRSVYSAPLTTAG